MKQEIRIIKTQRQYDEALARLSALMEVDFEAGSPEEAELELLALVIQAYERSKVEPVFPDPIDAILFRMDQQGLKKKDMAQFFGSPSKASEVLSRKRALSLSMMRKLHKDLGIPAEVLLGGAEDDLDLSTEPAYDYDSFPWQEMINRRYFGGFSGSVREARNIGEELIRGFFRGINLGPIQFARLRAPMHQSGSRAMDEYALCVWTVAVLKKARQLAIAKPFSRKVMTPEWFHDLAKLSRFEQGPRLAQEYLADAGIAMVIESHFDKTYLDGAALLDVDRPIVALTLRHDRLDNFWFALFHELIHILEHLTPQHNFIPDNLDDKLLSQSREEQEANDGARDALIPQGEWQAFDISRDQSPDNVNALANKLRIHPAIVAGRVRYETQNWRLLTGFKASVRQHFADQLGGGAHLS